VPTVTTKDGSAIFYIFSGTAATHHYKYRPAAICAAKAWSRSMCMILATL